jgi:DNA-binding NarL/FixJ family response regulator
MGALVAGLSIAAFPYSIHVTAKTLPLRDFFLTLFFVSLGMKITAPNWGMVLPVLGIVAFVFASRFASVYPLVVMTGAGRRAGFVASVNLAQISEFSLVIASLGVAYGHIGKGTVAITIYAMAIMAVLSSYAIRYSHNLYVLFEGLIGGRTRTASDEAESVTAHPEIVLLGYHRGARALVEALERRDPALLKRTLVIDFNPVSLDEAKARGVGALFGDIASIEVLKHAHIGHAKYIISTIPDLLLKGVDNAELVEMSKSIAPHATVIATADDAQHERVLRAKGAGAVVRVYEMAADALAEAVTQTQRARRRTDAVATSIVAA